MRKLGEIAYVFLFGCFLYSLIEIAARGRTHWSMTLTGGACLAFIYHITTRSKMNLFVRCLAGTVFITVAEFVVGFYVNIMMKWNVWDYSDVPVNFMGQICLPFSLIWFCLCIVGSSICRKIEKKFVGTDDKNSCSGNTENTVLFSDEEFRPDSL
jgi:uncharacterized membrane protein